MILTTPEPAEGKHTPQYRHDCARCIFIGRILGVLPEMDAYVCPGQSIILRFANNGPDYWSSPIGMIDQVASAGAIWKDGQKTDQLVYTGMGIIGQWVRDEAVRRGHITPKEQA